MQLAPIKLALKHEGREYRHNRRLTLDSLKVDPSIFSPSMIAMVDQKSFSPAGAPRGTPLPGCPAITLDEAADQADLIDRIYGVYSPVEVMLDIETWTLRSKRNSPVSDATWLSAASAILGAATEGIESTTVDNADHAGVRSVGHYGHIGSTWPSNHQGGCDALTQGSFVAPSIYGTAPTKSEYNRMYNRVAEARRVCEKSSHDHECEVMPVASLFELSWAAKRPYTDISSKIMETTIKAACDAGADSQCLWGRVRGEFDIKRVQDHLDRWAEVAVGLGVAVASGTLVTLGELWPFAPFDQFGKFRPWQADSAEAWRESA